MKWTPSSSLERPSARRKPEVRLDGHGVPTSELSLLP